MLDGAERFVQQFFREGLGKLEGFKQAFFESTFVVTFFFSGNRTQPLKNAFCEIK
jgi:hypothetical protein